MTYNVFGGTLNLIQPNHPNPAAKVLSTLVVQCLLWYASVVHPYHMTKPTQVCFSESVIYALLSSSCPDFSMLPFVSKKRRLWLAVRTENVVIEPPDIETIWDWTVAKPEACHQCNIWIKCWRRSWLLSRVPVHSRNRTFVLILF